MHAGQIRAQRGKQQRNADCGITNVTSPCASGKSRKHKHTLPRECDEWDGHPGIQPRVPQGESATAVAVNSTKANGPEPNPAYACNPFGKTVDQVEYNWSVQMMGGNEPAITEKRRQSGGEENKNMTNYVSRRFACATS